MKNILQWIIAFLCATQLYANGEPAPTARLAIELAHEADHHEAAIEFRRLALSDVSEEERAGYYWLSAYEYSKYGKGKISSEMLDRAESLLPKLAPKGSLLRAENATLRNAKDEAGFYYQSTLSLGGDSAALAARRLATINLRANKPDKAARQLEQFAPTHTEGRQAIKDYIAGKDKSPRLGGLLGMIPGLGHAYSGEYANALRCLILNSLFIYGMAETADDDQWGAFAVITFFELTWYSGSIYGGIDAAHRYNKRRIGDCVDKIEGESGYAPDWKMIPTIRLEFVF